MKTLTGIIAVSLFLLISGCATIRMPSYINQPIASYDNSNNSMQSIEKAIIKSAVSLGWQTKKVAEGEIEATLDIRQHHLAVLITHDTETVSVKYVDSTNLKYNGRKIHRQYANWITNLLRTINANNLVN